MKEYRIFNINKDLKKKLKSMAISLIQEKFAGKVTWLFYYDGDDDIAALLNNHDIEFTTNNVEELGWEDRWKNYLKDGWLTEDVYYCFDNKRFSDNRKVLYINPSLAFGTGSHGSTQAAASLLAKVSYSKKVFDVGSGSGILSILAVIKGASQVAGCDIDVVTLNNAKENAALNNVSINFYHGAPEMAYKQIGFEPDIIVANIISSVLKELHPFFITLRPKYIIYSGITEQEHKRFIKYLSSHTESIGKYDVSEYLLIDGWCGIMLERKC